MVRFQHFPTIPTSEERTEETGLSLSVQSPRYKQKGGEKVSKSSKIGKVFHPFMHLYEDSWIIFCFGGCGKLVELC